MLRRALFSAASLAAAIAWAAPGMVLAEDGFPAPAQQININDIEAEVYEKPPAGDCGIDARCCATAPSWGVFGEFLMIRPRDIEVAYAMPVDGPIAPVLGNGTQIGPAAIVDFDYQDGFRGGASASLGGCGYVQATYTTFDSDTSNAVAIAPPDVIRSLVTHPLGANAAFDGLNAAAALDVQYDTFDVDFVYLEECCNYSYGWLLGARYARIDQEFAAAFETNGGTFVDTNVDFEGAGVRVGALGDWHVCSMLLYFRTSASLLAGESSATFVQGDVGDPVQVATSWEAGRLVTVLDMELGVGWQSTGGGLRLTAGYLLSGWLNMVQTDEFITAVQQNQFNQGFDNLGDLMSFDGLTARAEVRF